MDLLISTIPATNCTPQTIVIGRRGTYNTQQIDFDLSYLIESYGAGVAALMVMRSQDETAYPAVVSQDGTTLTWTISEIDTYYVGSGEVQLMWYVDGGLAKTIIYPMVVMRDILQTTEEPPDAYQTWVDDLTALGAETLQNAQDAAQSALEAEQSATDAGAAKTAAENAQTAAETAQGLAEDAQTAAETAQGKAETAQGKAETAQEKAETAQTAAEAAADRAEDALEEFTTPTASATTLAPSAPATASYANGHFTFGIPKGDVGSTPDFSIGSVETLQPSQPATASITGTVTGTGDITITIDDQDFVFEVNGFPAYITVDNVAIIAGEDATVTVTLLDDQGPMAEKDITLIVGDTEYTAATDDEGIATFTIPDLAKGNYIAQAIFAGDDLYDEASGAGLIMVSDTILTVDVPTIDYGTPITINVGLVDVDDNPLSGLVIVNINGEDYNVLVTDGEGTIEVNEVLDAGDYTVNAKYIGDSVTTAESTFTVYPLSADMTVSVEDISYGNGFTINIEFSDDSVSGLVIVNINEIDYAIYVENGAGSKDINVILDADTYDVFAQIDDVNYDVEPASSSFTVKPLGTTLTITTEDISFGEDAVFDITLVDENGEGLTAAVTVTVDKDYTVAVANGVATLVISDLAPGTYTVEAAFLADNYEESSATAEITVSEVPEYAIEVEATNESAIVTLTDDEGNPIEGAEIEYAVNGESATATTDKDGKATIPLDGNSTVEVTYTDDNGATTSISTEVVLVDNIVEVEKIVEKNVTVEVPVNATISLAYEDGKVVATLTEKRNNRYRNRNRICKRNR